MTPIHPDAAALVPDATGAGARPLRVAVVTETWPPEVNGVAATVAQVVHGLRHRGHAVQVVRPRQPHETRAGAAGDPLELQVPGLPIPCYPQLRMGVPVVGRLRRQWQAWQPQVVHIATEGPLGWAALRAARQLAVPVVSDFRTNFQAYSRHYGMPWLEAPMLAYLRHFHNRTACTMVPTEGLRSALAAAGFQGLRVVARGVDAQRFHPHHRRESLRAQWGAAPHTPVAVCVGRLAPEKNLVVAVAAAQHMREVAPDLKLVFVGDGPQRARLQRLCPEAVFAGPRRGEDLLAHYASADVCLFPSLTETFGNVVTEAMASGLAVVAYDQAAAGELIRHGHNGLLASAGDTAGFCHIARQLAEDLPLARRIGQHARQTAEGLDWARILEAIESQYALAMTASTGADMVQRHAAMHASVPPVGVSAPTRR